MSGFRRRLLRGENIDKIPWIEIQETLVFGDSISSIKEMWDIDTGKVFRPDDDGTFILQLDSYPAKIGIEWNPNVTTVREDLLSSRWISKISPYLFAPIAGTVKIFHWTFRNNIGLVSVPVGLFNGMVDVEQFTETFKGCSNLKGQTPKSDGMELWERFPDADGTECFSGCTSLENYDEIPDGWK